MNKKEKYYNYVVEDLVSKTEIDYDQEIIKLTYPSFPLPLLLFLFLSSPSHSFSNYIKKMYGAHSEEIEIIWKLYKERIQSLINNE